MLETKRRLQIAASLAVATVILTVGLVGALTAGLTRWTGSATMLCVQAGVLNWTRWSAVPTSTVG